MRPKTISIPIGWLSGMKKLSDEEFGRLIRWYMDYANGGGLSPPEGKEAAYVKYCVSLSEAKIRFSDTVFLTQDEYENLRTRFGFSDTAQLIEILDSYKKRNKVEYKSDYDAILRWCVKNLGEKRKSSKKEPEWKKSLNAAMEYVMKGETPKIEEDD